MPENEVTRLGREIRNAHAGLRAALRNRADHPSYGYTKAGIRQRLARLEGLIAAHAIMTGAANSGDPFFCVPEHANTFDIDIPGLARSI